MKRTISVLAVLALLLVTLPIIISCDNPTEDNGSSDFTGYVNVDDQTQSTPTLPQTYVGGQPLNPPDMEAKSSTKPDGTTLIETTGNAGSDTVGANAGGIKNPTVKNEFYGTLGSDFNLAGGKVSAMVLTGIVDPTKPGTIKQYNQAFNVYTLAAFSPYTPEDNFIFNLGNSDVYKERSYSAGGYYPAALGGFDILLWSGAPSKIITLYVTQDGVTKTYVIDYSDLEF
jgi:hypothetical protein